MFKKFKKIIDIMMDKDLSELKEDYSQSSYQWIKGENISQVQHYKDLVNENGKTYVLFTDGNRMSTDLLEEFMIRVEKGYEEVSLDSAPQENETQNISKSSVKPRESEQKKSIVIEENPIFSLLSKQKENWVDVDLKLSINLPPKSLWDILISSFDDAEKDILEFVTKDLDIEVVRQSLRESIKEIYKKQKNPTSVKNVRSQDSISE
jgi:protease II